MIKAGIIGATGYAGNELVRILMGHKEVEIKWYGSRSYIDKKYAEVYQNMLNRSFYEVFENGDKKWLVTYADVALNGNKHILHDYSPEIDKTLTIYCFQPAPGYCACVLIPS